MGGHRGDAALKALTPVGVREIGVATVCGLVGGFGWWVFVRGNRMEWAAINKNYQVQKAERRKKFESWLATQPYDDETA